MLDFVLFAGTAILGLLILLFFVYRDSSETKAVGDKSSGRMIPRWNVPPADEVNGDFGEIAKWGSLHQYLTHLHGNGEVPVTSFWWGATHVVSVCSPQAFKELVGLVNRPELLFRGFQAMIGETSIQYSNEEDWEHRQKCIYKTLKGEYLKSYFSNFVAIAKEAESAWSCYSASDKVSLRAVIFPLTIKGIVISCMGNVFEDDEEISRFSDAYHHCWKEMEEWLTLSSTPEEGSERKLKFEEQRKVMEDIVLRLIHSCKKGEQENPPLIDSMLQNYSSEKNKLYEELIQEVGGDSGDRLEEYALRSDTFMRQVQDETLRLSTLASWAARYSDKDVSVCGYSVPAGTPIITALGVALQNTTQWKDEQKWDPSRFSSTSAHGKRGNEFCPFGIHSRRKCPGYLFSYFEVAIFLALLIPSFEVIPVEGQEVEKVYGLVTEPKNDLAVYFHKRK